MSDASPPLGGEPFLSLSQAARRFPGHRGADRLHPATLTRWIIRGCLAPDGQRVRLSAVRAGSRWLTSEAAIARFVSALTPAAEPAGPVTRSPAAARHAAEVAARELDRLGA